MDKRNGNSPSAYQTISQFCEESSFGDLDNHHHSVDLTQHRKFSSTLVKLLTTNPLRRKRSSIPG